MGKRKSTALIESDDSRSSDSDSGSGSDLDTKEMLASRKKGGAKSSKAAKLDTFTSSSGSSSSSSGSDSDSDNDEAPSSKPAAVSGKKGGGGGPAPVNAGKRKPAKRARRSTSGTTQSSLTSSDEDDDKASNNQRSPSSAEVTSSSRPGIPPSSAVSSTVSNSGGDKKEQTQSDLEEGEVSDDEDGAGDSSETEEFNDGYDENMMGDEEDQRRLSAMTEKEREQEIFKRIELRDTLRHRHEVEKKLRKKTRMEARKANKSRGKVGGSGLPSSSTVGQIASTLSIDEEPSGGFSSMGGSGFPPSSKDEFQMDAKVRSQERKKTVEAKVDKKTQAMDALKATRDAKIQRAQEKEKEKIRKEAEMKRDDDDDDDLGMKKDDDGVSSVGDKRHQKKLKTSDIYSDDSEGSDSGSEDGSSSVKKDKKLKKDDSGSSSSSSDSEDDVRHKKPQYIEKTEDLNRIRMSRFKLERWAYYPMFARVAKGCFVRAAMSKGAALIYKVCEIVEVIDGVKIYQVGAIRTNKVLLLCVNGNPDNKQKVRFEFVSNTAFTDEEFNIFKANCANNNQVLPTIDEITKKEKEIKGLIEYQLQEEDVEAIVQEKAKFKNSPVNFAAKKTQLMKEKEMAITNGDDERVAILTTEIHDLDERAKELDKARTSTISSISYINERNRKKNVEEAEKAILEELKSTRGLKVEDPFTRRNTKPRIVSKPNAHLNGSVVIKEEDGVKTESNSASSDTVDGSGNSGPLCTPEFKDADVKSELASSIGDLFSAHDFDIKLDLDAKLPPANLPILARPSVTPIKETAPRRSLNLEEYKRKKGLI